MTQRIEGTFVSPFETLGSGRLIRVNVFTSVVVGLAVLAGLVGALMPGRAVLAYPLSTLGAAGVAAALAAGGQLARLRFRLGRGTVSISWAEAAFILGYAFAPPGWLPAATLVGAAVAWVLVSWLGDHRPRTEIPHLAASQALGAAGATLMTTVITWGSAGTTSVRLQIGLAAGALTYLVITLGLAVATLRLQRDEPAGRLIARALHAKLPMLAGNVLVGLLGLFALVHEPWWLLAGLPAFWLLQRTYRHHLREAGERRTWEAFAAATAALAGKDEETVADAGLRGALDVFGARRVELEVIRADGSRHSYAKDGPGPLVDPSGLAGPVITRSITVNGDPVGELTVWFADPTLPVTREELAVSVFGDALGGALHDAAARQEVAELATRVFHDARHDALTGLLNRAALLAAGDRLLRSIDRDRQVALLLLDLNNFREVNGTLGNRAGDDVLRTVAERILDLARDHEIVARLGDDEFAVLLPNVVVLADSGALRDTPTPVPQALRRARELVDQLAAPMEVAGVRLVVESSVGVAVNRAGGCDTAELTRRAALALDDAKKYGQGVATYDCTKDASNTDHLALLAELRDALAVRDQIVLALQPAVDLATSVPTGVEALTRWQHPRRGLVPPADFIYAIEDSELVAPFTRYVLDLSLAAARDWTAHGFDLPVSVNISARSLLDPTFPAQVGDLLRRHRMPAGRLVLEITESVAISEQEIVDEVLSSLREMGVQLSVDDFGTGYSSFSFLTRVPVEELKIDRSFVDEMIDSPIAAAVIKGSVELGKRLGVRVVAEGIETVEQRTALMEMGCTFAQGYHFCKPMSADRIVSALRDLNSTATGRIVPFRADDAV